MRSMGAGEKREKDQYNNTILLASITMTRTQAEVKRGPCSSALNIHYLFKTPFPSSFLLCDQRLLAALNYAAGLVSEERRMGERERDRTQPGRCDRRDLEGCSLHPLSGTLNPSKATGSTCARRPLCRPPSVRQLILIVPLILLLFIRTHISSVRLFNVGGIRI